MPESLGIIPEAGDENPEKVYRSEFLRLCGLVAGAATVGQLFVSKEEAENPWDSYEIEGNALRIVKRNGVYIQGEDVEMLIGDENSEVNSVIKARVNEDVFLKCLYRASEALGIKDKLENYFDCYPLRICIHTRFPTFEPARYYDSFSNKLPFFAFSEIFMWSYLMTSRIQSKERRAGKLVSLEECVAHEFKHLLDDARGACELRRRFIIGSAYGAMVAGGYMGSRNTEGKDDQDCLSSTGGSRSLLARGLRGTILGGLLGIVTMKGFEKATKKLLEESASYFGCEVLEWIPEYENEFQGNFFNFNTIRNNRV